MTIRPDLPAAATTGPPPAPLASALLRGVLEGAAEAVVLCAADDAVLLVNAAARRLLPGLAEGCSTRTGTAVAGLARATRDGSTTFVTEHAGRQIHGRRDVLDPAHYVWYLRDCTEEQTRGAALTAERARTSFLAEASRRLSASLHQRRCVRTTVELAVSHLADAAVVMLPPERRRVGWLRAVAGGDHDAGAVIDEGTVRENAAADVPGLTEALAGFPPVPSRWLDPRQAPAWLLPDGFGEVGALLVTPLPGNGEPAGALVLARRAPHPGFDEKEELLARIFAARAGAAISAAALYREQVDTAAILQADLLPPALPTVDGVELVGAYRPAKEAMRIGGDFYDVLPSAGAGGDTMVVLGDVCGKGPEAAVLTGKVRQTLRALRLIEQRPERMLHVLNQALLHPGGRGRFVTLVLGTVARAEHGRLRMTLAAAGHPAPLVLRRDGTVDEVDTRGTLIGVMRQTSIRPATIELAPGELCLLYSDGLTEARGGPTGRELYGEERLKAALASCHGMPAAAVVERVEQLSCEWVEGGAHDDIAMLVVRAPARTPLTLAGAETGRAPRFVDARRTAGRGRQR